MSKTEYYLTQEGYDNLKAEYARLKEEEWPAVVKRVSAARELGKLEDNQEFDEASKAKDILEGKLTEIQEVIEGASIIKNGQKNGTVDLGSTITVEVNGDHHTFTIVGSMESDPSQGKISHESPVGKQLLGLKKGDTIEVQLPTTSIKYTIVKIHR